MYKTGIALLLFVIGLYPMATEAGEIAAGVVLVFGITFALIGAVIDWFKED